EADEEEILRPMREIVDLVDQAQINEDDERFDVAEELYDRAAQRLNDLAEVAGVGGPEMERAATLLAQMAREMRDAKDMGPLAAQIEEWAKKRKNWVEETGGLPKYIRRI